MDFDHVWTEHYPVTLIKYMHVSNMMRRQQKLNVDGDGKLVIGPKSRP